MYIDHRDHHGDCAALMHDHNDRNSNVSDSNNESNSGGSDSDDSEASILFDDDDSEDDASTTSNTSKRNFKRQSKGKCLYTYVYQQKYCPTVSGTC
jgi:hypothetical protein